MELIQNLLDSSVVNEDSYQLPEYQPQTYTDMDGWLNSLPAHSWLGLLGAYASGGFDNVILYLKKIYAFNLDKWRNKDLRHFFNSRNINDFKSRWERRAA